MTTNHNENLSECARTQADLAGFMENTLSARQMWDVEKHLARCVDCARLSHEMQATVALLKSVERRDTSDDFMARLHARIDTLEPETVRAPSVGTLLRDWLAGMSHTLRAVRVPALSLGVAATAVIVLLVIPHSAPQKIDTPANITLSNSVTQIAAEPLRRNAALAANNPFDDPVAAALESHSDANEGETQ